MADLPGAASDEAPLEASTLEMLQEALSAVGEDLATASSLAALARAVSVQRTDPAKARELALEVVGLANMTARLRASLAQAASMSARCGSPPCEGETTSSSGLSSSSTSTASLGSGSTPATCGCPSPEGPTSSGSGSGGSSGSCRCCCVAGDDRDTAGWDGSAPVVGSKRTQRPSDDMPPPAPRRPRRAPGGKAAAAASPAPAAGGPVAAAQWDGRLLHRRGGMVVELAQLSMSVPAAFAGQLPGALHAAELAPRRAVPLGRHAVCRCALLPGTSARQAAALGAMAGASLVAVVPLQQSDLIVVPYLDGAGAVRVVAFLRIRA